MPVLSQRPWEMPAVEGLSTEFQPDGALRSQGESSRQGPRWGRCGRELPQVHGDDRPIQVRHLPLLERRVYREIRPKRDRCPHGAGRPTTTQRWAWYDPTRPHPQACEKRGLRCLGNSTVVAVSPTLGLGPDAVEGIRGRGVSTTVEGNPFPPLETLGLDESALTRGYGNDGAVIRTRDNQGPGSVGAVLPERRKATVKGGLEAMPAPLKATLQPVGIDRDEGAAKAVSEAVPGVTVVVDRLHGAPPDPAGVDRLRQQELNRLPQELPEAEDQPLQGLWWVVRPAWTVLSEADPNRWLPLFHQSQALPPAACRRPVLTGICNRALSKDRATEAIPKGCDQVRARGFQGGEACLTRLANWREEISHDFLQRQSSGVVEGLNNKLKVWNRRCDGLDSGKPLFQRLWLDLKGDGVFGMG